MIRIKKESDYSTNFGKKVSRSLILLSSFLLTSIILKSPAYANPTGGQVTSGNATITNPSANTVQINQTSSKAIINWQSFNIDHNQTTHFQQPAGGVVLNRISPTQGASQIYGRLTATGQVILMNPAGVYFGPSAYVNVGGLIATTATITDQNFLNGNYTFTHDGVGSIINEGTLIAANNGLIALIGDNVQNNGLIQANLGHVVLAAGDSFTMSFAGNDLISFSVDGKSLNGRISNTGTLSANGGQVLVSAKSAAGVLDNVINMQGVAEAKSVGVKNGEIILLADAGVVKVSGSINASGKQTGEKGGKVKITGHNVLVDSSATIDASGDVGGGEILIGGNYQGKGPLANAKATVIAENTHINADAITQGNGGDIIVWSDEVTKTYGNISARGGALGGNGGFIETSSHDFLDIGNVQVDISAPNGQAGTWLLDPRNVTIVAGSTNTGINSSNPFVPTADDSQLSITSLLNAFTGGANVIVSTGVTGSQTGTITLATPLDYNGTGTNTLTLNAKSGIVFNANISDSVAGGDVLNLNLNADTDSDGVGTFTVASGVGVQTNNGNIVLNAADIDLVGTLNLGTTGDMTITTSINSAGLGNVAGQGFTMSGAELQNITARNFTMLGGLNRSYKIDGVSAANSANISGTVFLGQDLASTSNDVSFQNSGSTFKTLTLSSSSGVFFTTGGLTITTGPLIIDANSNNDATGNFDISSPLVLNTSGATGSKNITIKAVDVVIGSTSSVNAGTGIITINASGSIGLGATAGTMTITGTELQNMTASALNLNAGSDSAITVNNISSTNSANISGGVTLDATTGTLGSINFSTNNSTFKALTAYADNGVTFNRSVTTTTGGITVDANRDADSTGTLTVAASQALTSTNNPISLTARDIVLTGTLAAGTNSVTINGTSSLGLGAGVGNMGITNTELQNITAANLNLNAGADSAIVADGLTTAALANISGNINLDATNGTLGTITFSGSDSNFNKNLSLAADSGITQSAAIIANTSGKTVTIAANSGDATLNTATNDFATVLVSSGRTVSLTDANALTLGTSTVTNQLTAVAGGALTLSGALTGNNAASGDSIVLAGASFNNSGAYALNTGSGRFLIWTANPSLDNQGGLASSFKQYNATYGVSTVLGSGNGFLYTQAPVITVSLIGSTSKVYDTTTTAALASGNYSQSGAVNGDTVTINNPASGTYNNANVGSSKNVSVSGLSITGASNGAITVYGYQLAATTANANIGDITPATLTASLTGSTTKVYDTTTVASLTSGNYNLSGVLGSDTVTLNDPSTGVYNNANVGSAKNVSVSGLSISGASASNYVLSSTTANANIGDITPATLTASLTGSTTKVYDTTTVASLTSGNYNLSGVLGSDTVTLNDPSTGVYNNANVGSAKNVSVSGLSISGASASNYVLSSTTANANIGDITPATLTASLTGSTTKVYDTTTVASLTSGNYNLSGVLGSDVVNLNDPSTGVYNNANVGSAKNVSVSGLSISGASASNYVLSSTTANANIGDITPATLTASLTGSTTKVYDTTTVASLTSGNYNLSGVLGSDVVNLNDPSTGVYNNANVGSAKNVSVSGLSISGASASNYVLSSTTANANIGDITPATLTASLTGSTTKVYDTTTVASLTSGNYNLSGVLGSDTVTLNDPSTGVYNNANVGSAKNVSVSGLSISGASASNYVLSSTTANANIGDITPATVTASLTGSTTKVYDTTTVASLTSGNYNLSGVLGSDVVNLNDPSTGVYNNANVGSAKNVSVSGLSISGASASNYVLSSTTANANIGDITPATLTASLTGSTTKVYDTTTVASLTSGNYNLSGVLGSDTVTLNDPSTGVYNNANVGSAKNVSVSGLSISGASASNYVLSSTTANANIGDITPATLTASLTGSTTKVYDTTTVASLTSGNYNLSGVLGSDVVNLNDPSTGVYNNANVGSAKNVSVSGLSISGASASNYVLSSTTANANIGDITPATLTASLTGTVSKVYDGNAIATLAPSNYHLAGVYSGDTVNLNDPTTGLYNNPDVGTNKNVAVAGLSISGASASNYVLSATTADANIGVITSDTPMPPTPTPTPEPTPSVTPALGTYVANIILPFNGANRSVSSVTVKNNNLQNNLLIIKDMFKIQSKLIIIEGVTTSKATNLFNNSRNDTRNLLTTSFLTEE